MKFAVYCRVSTRDKGQDIGMQRQYIEEYARREGLEIFRVYEDEGYSGGKDSRPAFDRMLEDLREGLFQGIVVYKLDRIGRSLPHLVKLFEEFSKKRVAFISATQNIKTDTPEGEMFLNMLMVFAQYERGLTINRIKDGQEKARKEGKQIGKRGKDKGARRKSGYYMRWAGKKTSPRKKAAVPIAEPHG